MDVYLNGRYLDEKAACVSIADRGFLYGDALYENVRVYKGGFFRFREHLRRLTAGAEALRIDPPSESSLRHVATQITRRNGLSDGTVRITLTRGPGGRGLRTPGAGPPTVLVTAAAIARERIERAAAGWHAIIARSRRSPVGLPASIKSANRLDAILARLEADEAGVDEAILLSSDGFVAEGTISNVFWREGSRLCTPDLSVGILPGVTRGTVVELAAQLGVPVEEGRWPADSIRRAPEVFVTMSSLGPVRLASLDSRSLTPGPEDIWPRVRESYWSLVEREAASDPIADGASD